MFFGCPNKGGVGGFPRKIYEIMHYVDYFYYKKSLSVIVNINSAA
jgi:hypothetical protein